MQWAILDLSAGAGAPTDIPVSAKVGAGTSDENGGQLSFEASTVLRDGDLVTERLPDERLLFSRLHLPD